MSRVTGTRWRGPRPARRPDRAALAAGRLLAHLLPERRGALEEAALLLAERAAACPVEPTVHGDLYEGQIVVDGAGRLGLIDLDDAGPGDPLLDAANLLAHLTVLGHSSRRAGRRPLAYARPALLGALDAGEDDLRWREALCLLLLATGPFRVLARDWPATVEARATLALRRLRPRR